MEHNILRKMYKRRGGISIVIISLILIMLVLVSLPSLQSLVNSNAKASSNISKQIENVTKP